MAETSAFYDPGTYDCATIATAFLRYCGTGVVPGYLNKLAVTATTGMGVSVNTGGAILNGYHYWNSTAKALTHDAADVTHTRIDRIVIRNTSTGSPGAGVAMILKGTPATPAVAPTMTNTATVTYISLAQVSIAVGVTTITDAMITDERSSDTYCGWARPAAVGKTAYANVDMNGFKATGLGAPSGATDAARLDSIAATKLDDLTAPDDNTDLDFSTAKHGLCPKGPNAGKFLRDDATWQPVTVYKTASAGDTLQSSVDTETMVSSTAYVLLATIYIPGNYNWGSTFRVKFDIKGSSTSSYVYGRVYFNGFAVGAEQSDITAAYVTKTQDIALGPGILQLYGRSPSFPMNQGYYRNFRVYCTDTNTVPGWA